MPPPGKNPPQRKNWRDGAKPSRAAPAGRGRGAGWVAKTADDQYQSARRKYWLRIGIWSTLFIGLVAAFIIYILRRPIATPLVAFAATKYAAPLPPNSYATEDLEGLRLLDKEVPGAKEKRILAYHAGPEWQSKEKWLVGLRDKIVAAGTGGPQKNTIIIYLSLHGVVNGDGEPCLIPPGAAPWDSKMWVPVREMLADVFLSEKQAAKIKRWNKLLVLDCNRIDANWGLGLFYNDFAERLGKAVEEARVKDPRLFVLNSTSTGRSAGPRRNFAARSSDTSSRRGSTARLTSSARGTRTGKYRSMSCAST